MAYNTSKKILRYDAYAVNKHCNKHFIGRDNYFNIPA